MRNDNSVTPVSPNRGSNVTRRPQSAACRLLGRSTSSPTVSSTLKPDESQDIARQTLPRIQAPGCDTALEATKGTRWQRNVGGRWPCAHKAEAVHPQPGRVRALICNWPAAHFCKDSMLIVPAGSEPIGPPYRVVAVCDLRKRKEELQKKTALVVAYDMERLRQFGAGLGLDPLKASNSVLARDCICSDMVPIKSWYGEVQLTLRPPENIKGEVYVVLRIVKTSDPRDFPDWQPIGDPLIIKIEPRISREEKKLMGRLRQELDSSQLKAVREELDRSHASRKEALDARAELRAALAKAQFELKAMQEEKMTLTAHVEEVTQDLEAPTNSETTREVAADLRHALDVSKGLVPAQSKEARDKKAAEAKEEEAAATRIQAQYRRKAGTSKVAAIRAEKEAAEKRDAEAKEEEAAATRIQAQYRRKAGASKVTAKRAEKEAAEKQAAEEKEEEERAASKIQSQYRRKAGASKVAAKRAEKEAADKKAAETKEEEAAATKIQAQYRRKADAAKVAAKKAEKEDADKGDTEGKKNDGAEEPDKKTSEDRADEDVDEVNAAEPGETVPEQDSNGKGAQEIEQNPDLADGAKPEGEAKDA